MSRIRSQLDSLLDKPRAPEGRPASPAPIPQRTTLPPSAPTPSQEIARIRHILDDLAGKLSPASRPVRPPEPAASAQPSRPAIPPAPAADPALRRQLEEGLDRLRRELGQAVAAGPAQAASTNELADELRAVGQAVARLESRAASAPDRMGDVAVELRQLRMATEQLAASRETLDLAEIARAIEAGNAAMVERLDGRLGELAGALPQDGGQAHSQFGALSDQVAAIGDALERMPGAFPFAAIEERLAGLATAVGALAQGEDDGVARHFAHLNERLDEITRAMVAVSVQPGSDALDRVEARVASLAKTIETMAEERRLAEVEADRDSDAFASEIVSALQAIDGKLGALDRETAAPQAGPAFVGMEEIAGQVALLSQKLDNLPAFGSAAAALSGGDGEVLARLDEISTRLGSLFELANAPAEDEAGEILEILRALTDRVEVLGAREAEPYPAAGQIEALERQLGAIVAQLGTLSTGGVELGPISERLDHIERQVVASRDIAIDAANQAAERFAGLALGGETIDAGLIEGLRAELRSLGSNSREIGTRNADALQTVHEALSEIADRLAEIEGRFDDAPRPREDWRETRIEDWSEDPYEAPPVSTAMPVEAAAPARPQAAPAIHALEPGRHAAEIHAPEPEIETDEAMEPGDFDSSPAEDAEFEGRPLFGARRVPAVSAVGEDEPADPGLTQTEESPPLAPDEMAPAEAGDDTPIEDVPLEPGSGAPDFVELVRQASARRKAGDAAASSSGASDLIAAARRAAQAAAREAGQPAAEEARAEEPKAPSGRLAGLKAMLSRHGRTVALVALLAGAAAYVAPMAMRYLDRPREVAALPAAEETQQAAIAPEQPEASAEAAEPPEPVAPASPQTQAAAPVETAPEAEEMAAAVPALPARPEEPAAAESGEIEPAAPGETAPLSRSLPQPGEEITSAPMPPAEIGNVALRHAAANGDGAALFEVARRYTDGVGVERDLTRAAEWYEYSARTGFAPAQYRLGNFFEKGHGVAVDLKKAVLWYQRAAEQGNALAMHNLAVLQTSGIVGAGPDMTAAVEWFRRAAELGVKDSQVNLGILYTRGMGVNEDLVEAHKRFALAARAGDSDAAGKRDTLATAMRPDQLTKARGLAEIWKPGELDPSVNTVETKTEWTVTAGHSAALAPAVVAPARNEAVAEISPREMVRQAQELLARRGFDPGPADGVMGRKTRDAVMEFQRNEGMEANGEVSAELLKALGGGAA